MKILPIDEFYLVQKRQSTDLEALNCRGSNLTRYAVRNTIAVEELPLGGFSFRSLDTLNCRLPGEVAPDRGGVDDIALFANKFSERPNGCCRGLLVIYIAGQ